MIRLTALIALLLAAPLALAADLTTTWSAVDSDDAGFPLATPVEEYRVYDCSDLSTPIATVPGTQLSYLEADAIQSTGTFCRAVAAYIAPFEGATIQGTLVVVVPGQPATINV